jgi:hypothetical protein
MMTWRPSSAREQPAGFGERVEDGRAAPASMAEIASAMVAPSSVGPVMGPTAREKGATITRRPQSEVGRRRPAARTKSIRRCMLWLRSTSSVKVAGSVSGCTRSSVCGSSFSNSEKWL